MKTIQISNASQLEAVVNEIGLLPFWSSGFPGYSLAEMTAPGYWFEDGVDGAWEWREELAGGGRIAYGKLFRNKAGFVSMDWYPDLCNYRRDGYDFDARYDDGLASRRCKLIMDALVKNGPLLTHEIKRCAGFGGDGEKGFEAALSILQMQTYITVKEFVYKRDKYGKPYGRGVGRYALAEDVFGEEVTTGKYETEPFASRDAIAAHLSSLLPDADFTTIHKFIK